MNFKMENHEFSIYGFKTFQQICYDIFHRSRHFLLLFFDLCYSVHLHASIIICSLFLDQQLIPYHLAVVHSCWAMIFVCAHSSGVTTDPADPAMRGARGPMGAQNCGINFFHCKFNTAIFVWTCTVN